jgi:hypothetical protein
MTNVAKAFETRGADAIVVKLVVVVVAVVVVLLIIKITIVVVVVGCSRVEKCVKLEQIVDDGRAINTLQ